MLEIIKQLQHRGVVVTDLDSGARSVLPIDESGWRSILRIHSVSPFETMHLRIPIAKSVLSVVLTIFEMQDGLVLRANVSGFEKVVSAAVSFLPNTLDPVDLVVRLEVFKMRWCFLFEELLALSDKYLVRSKHDVVNFHQELWLPIQQRLYVAQAA